MVQRTTKLVPLLLLLCASVSHAQLDLPGKKKPIPVQPRGDVAPGPQAEPLELPPSEGPASTPVATPSLAEGASAVALFEGVARAKKASTVAVEIERLIALGADAYPSARAALVTGHAPSVLAAGRVLLGGGASERELVARRLATPLPSEVGLVLLAELRARDPKLASPEFLAGLLDHSEPALRQAAQRALEERLGSDLLPALQATFSAGRVPARTAALELVARVDDPLALNLLVSRLADPSAQLAARAANLLAARPEADGLLREAAFGGEGRLPGPARLRSYALLALVLAEDKGGRVLLALDDVPALLPTLSASSPLEAGTAAIALARIGFRSSAAEVGPWLAREVPHQLVRCGTGVEFHSDFSALEKPALRALALLSGAPLGDDGAAWREWWLEQDEEFLPRHAVLELTPDAPAQLRVDGADANGPWVLLGPARASEDARGDVLRLDPAAAELLFGFLREAGAFDARHLPGPTGGVEPGVLKVAIGTREKRFTRGAEGEWFVYLAEQLARVRAENAWQRHPDGGRSRLEFWRAEAERWSLLAPEARRGELKRLILTGLRQPADARTREVRLAELEGLYALEGAPERGDLEALLGVLAQETSFGPRVERVLALVRRALAGSGEGETEVDPLGRLVAFTLDRYGTEAVAALRPLALELSPRALETLRADLRPAARALAAEALVRGHGPEDTEALLAALHDPEDLVVRTTLEGLASEPLEPARARILELARGKNSSMRAAALRALVPLGGKEVLDLAQECLGDLDPEVQLAAAWSLAELADPRAATLLASLLARGAGSPLHAEARRGLVRLGDVGVSECLRLSRAGGLRAQREGLLLLAELGRPEAVPGLLALLAQVPDDERVRSELSILAGVDFAKEQHPETAAFAWWDLVVHDDALAWFLAAAERVGVRTPPRTELEPRPSLQGARFLLEVAGVEEPLLVERALRELERLLGRTLERPEPEGRAEFLAALRVEVVRHFPK